MNLEEAKDIIRQYHITTEDNDYTDYLFGNLSQDDFTFLIFRDIEKRHQETCEYLSQRLHKALKKAPNYELMHEVLRRYYTFKEKGDFETAFKLISGLYKELSHDDDIFECIQDIVFRGYRLNSDIEFLWSIGGELVADVVKEYKKEFAIYNMTTQPQQTTMHIEQTQGTNKPWLTERVKKIFDAAIAKGYMRHNNGGYEWLGVDCNKARGHEQQWAYFCGKIWGYRTPDPEKMPSSELEKAFSIKNLSSKLIKVYQGDKQWWRTPIDEIIKSTL